MDVRPTDTRDLPTIARERMRIGPAPDWVSPCPYDAEFKPAIRGPLTHLLLERQIHAERGEIYVRHAVRLENMQAVQHESQWRVEFEPQTQSLVVHSIRIRRGATETEHLSLNRLQFLQREAGLEGCVIDGWITLLLLLEDVSPGDVLESSYTLTSRPKILPDHINSFFALPPGVQIGKYHFLVRHAAERKLRWKSSSPDLAPAITTEGAEVRCVWLGEKLSTPEPEDCTPAGHIDHPWIQVSDCADWQTVARAALDAWKDESTPEGLARLTEEIKSAGPDLLSQVNRAFELVQDSFRYLSVNLELGGQIPAPAETVIRRRYGDCKDLAYLLVRLLRGLGVSARPVLVHGMWLESISLMLPAPGVFNHVVVEFQIDNERRWVDATMKSQGGGPLKRLVPDFGLGLPIDAETLTLVPVPAASLPAGSIEVKESFILDTIGNPSYLSVVITAKGISAEAYRLEFENEGVEALAKKRLQDCANRYSRATRIGSLQYRDDRERNEFVLAEAFEIDGFLKQDGGHNTRLFLIQSDIAALLICPSINPRRNAFGLPYPCNRVHIIEVDFNGLDPITLPNFQGGNEFFSFTRRSKGLHKYFRVNFAFHSLADAVPADRVKGHRKQVESVWQECGLQIHLPGGYGRMRKPGDFGALPPATRPASSSGQSSAPTVPGPTLAPAPPAERPAPRKPVEAATPAAVAEQIEFVDPAKGVSRRRRSRRSHRGDSDYYSSVGRVRANPLARLGMYIFIGTVNAFWLGLLLMPVRETESFSKLLILAVMIAFPVSMILAAIGLKQCRNHPERYQRGRTAATVTLICGTLFGFMLLPGVIEGVKGLFKGPRRGPVLADEGELLKFSVLNFVYRMPEPPWKQIDARIYGRISVLALARPGPMFFTVAACPLDASVPDLKHMIEWSLANVHRETSTYQLLQEREYSLGSLTGWRMESATAVQGHEYFMVHWLLATNGFGYQLAMWGPADMSLRIKEEAERLFANFQLTPPLR